MKFFSIMFCVIRKTIFRSTKNSIWFFCLDSFLLILINRGAKATEAAREICAVNQIKFRVTKNLLSNNTKHHTKKFYFDRKFSNL